MRHFLKRSKKDLSIYIFWHISICSMLYLVIYSEVMNDETIKYSKKALFLNLIIFVFQILTFIFRRKKRIKLLFFVLNVIFMGNILFIYSQRVIVKWHSTSDWTLLNKNLTIKQNKIDIFFIGNIPEGKDVQNLYNIDLRKTDVHGNSCIKCSKEENSVASNQCNQPMNENITLNLENHTGDLTENLNYEDQNKNTSENDKKKLCLHDIENIKLNLKLNYKKFITQNINKDTLKLEIFLKFPEKITYEEIKICVISLETFRFSELIKCGYIVIVSKDIMEYLVHENLVDPL